MRNPEQRRKRNKVYMKGIQGKVGLSLRLLLGVRILNSLVLGFLLTCPVFLVFAICNCKMVFGGSAALLKHNLQTTISGKARVSCFFINSAALCTALLSVMRCTYECVLAGNPIFRKRNSMALIIAFHHFFCVIKPLSSLKKRL